MKTKEAYPPNYREICEVFDTVEKMNNVVFTYGDTLYNPNGCHIDPALRAHEATHVKQQGDQPGVWWSRYLTDKPFRLEQELEAYRVQYKKYCQDNRDRNQQVYFLMAIARDLSSPQYGNLCSLEEAKKLISKV